MTMLFRRQPKYHIIGLLTSIALLYVKVSGEMPILSLMHSNEEEAPPPWITDHLPFDQYGTPPDHYPAIIPDGESQVQTPDFYDYNTTSYDENGECQSVPNCPWEFSNPSSDPLPNLFTIPLNFMEYMPRAPINQNKDWRCKVEVDCYNQQQIPQNISNETEVLFLRNSIFTVIAKGNLSALPPLVKLRVEYSDLENIRPGAFAQQTSLEVR